MSLVPPILDDRTYDDLRAEAITRIRQACPNWTDFNPSDPGVTLVELFAWFTELMLHRMNQLPDKLHGELLDLIGVKATSATAAKALIEFTPNRNCPTIVPALTQSAPIKVGADRPLLFTTQRDLHMVLRPLEAINRLGANGANDTDLTGLNRDATNGFDPFGAEGLENSEFALRFTAQNASDAASLAFPEIITLHAKLAPRRPGNGSSAPRENSLQAVRPPLDWRASMKGGLFEPLGVVEDETVGFERDGFIRLAGPRRAVALERTPGTNKYAFELRCRVGGAGYGFGRAPRLLHLAVNAVDAIAQAWVSNERLGVSIGVPGQTFSLRNRPIDPTTLHLAVGASDNGAPTDWSRVDDFSQSRNDSANYTVDADSGQIRFGDGVQGAIPTAGLRIVALAYLAGGGVNGNVAAGAIAFSLGGANGANPYPAIGGGDAEPATHLRQRAAARLRSRDRAVTLGDFQDVALGEGQMGRAKAIGGLHPDYPELKGRMPGVVTVFVAGKPSPDGMAPPIASDAEIDNVTRILDSRRMLGWELFVRAANVVAIKLTIKLQPADGVAADDVRQAVRQSVNDWLSSDALGFGVKLYTADLWSRAAQAMVKEQPAVRQILELSGVVGQRPFKIGLPSDVPANEALNKDGTLALGDYDIPWGQPDHGIILERGG